MTVLGIETSCDETSAGVVRLKNGNPKLLSNVTSSSQGLHAKTGGIIPEIAAREQVRDIFPVIKEALSDAQLDFYRPQINAIAVTVGPGLIGSLLVGVETAKTLSLIWEKPIIPVNHLLGHIYANWLIADSKLQIENKPHAISHTLYATIEFPAIGLIVSGGHTDLILMSGHDNIRWIGGTRDDAAGEAFDKVGRMLDLAYPAGPAIENLAKVAKNPTEFPRPMISKGAFDFSFSGLKTAVYREIKDRKLSALEISNVCAGVQNSIVEVLTKKTVNAAQKYNVKSILLGGGVAANDSLRDAINLSATRHMLKAKIFVPQKSLCTDNGAMIAVYGLLNPGATSFEKVDANPSLYF